MKKYYKKEAGINGLIVLMLVIFYGSVLWVVFRFVWGIFCEILNKLN